ncbi:MAG: hypothetical protein ACJ8F3_06905 [Xanthobacteraceae bacterium]
MRRILHPLLILLALFFLLEAWLWERLAPLVAWIVARLPWHRIKAALRAWIMQLPPAATFAVFLVPIMLLLPLKFLGIWMLAHGSWLGALGVLAIAKVVSLGVTAFIFDLTRPKLLQLAWFRWLYDYVLVWVHWARELIDPIKQQLKRTFRLFAPKRAGRTMRLLLRIRRRILAGKAAA